MKDCRDILTNEDMERTLERLAYEVMEEHGDCAELAFIGIQRRGVDLAMRLKAILDERLHRDLPMGQLDINLYRDDWTTNLELAPTISCSEIGFEVEGTSIVLVDDVLYSGRTIRAALEAILDYGRPKRVELLVLVDRGHRELPIQADYVGKKLDTMGDEHVNVLVVERDGEDRVCLVRGE